MPYSPTSGIVKKLDDYFSENPEFKAAFVQSFMTAYATGLKEFTTFNIHSVDDYLRYMDEYVNWVPTEDVSGTNVYYHLCMFYFILDLPPVREHQSPIDPSACSPWRWLSEWLIEYAHEMGLWMDTGGSINESSVETFAKCPAYRDTPDTDFFEQYPMPSGGWKTFNKFFARHINPSFRPIADPTDPTVIVNPADCTFDGVWPINDTESADITTFDVKGVPWSISQLLDDNSDGSGMCFGPMFAGGIFTHSFLNATDYHRQHAPVSGRVVQAKVIPGLCYLEVVLKEADGKSPDGSHPRLVMHRPMFIQTRGLILIESDIGLVAVLPIGMAQVSSVVLSVKAGDYVEKGQDISCFQFGGSDIVMVFQKDAKVKLDQERNMHYNFGSRVGTGQVISK